MKSNADLERAIAVRYAKQADHEVELAMINARIHALARLGAMESHRWRQEMVAASPAARERLLQIEREEAERVLSAAKRVVQMRRVTKPHVVARKAIRGGR